MTVSHPLPADLVELIAERFRALSEPTRIKLLDQLREGEASVLELTEAIGTTQQNVSKHLGVLQRAGIVGRRKRGNFAYYSIADACSSSARPFAAASSGNWSRSARSSQAPGGAEHARAVPDGMVSRLTADPPAADRARARLPQPPGAGRA